MSFTLLDQDQQLTFAEKDELWNKVIEINPHGAPSREDMKAVMKLHPTRTLFYEFLKDRFCEENLEFYLSTERIVQNLKVYTEKRKVKAEKKLENRVPSRNSNGLVIQRQILQLLTRYLSDTASKPINIDYRLRKNLLECIEQGDTDRLLIVLDDVENEVLQLLYQGAYQEFRSHHEFISFIEKKKSIIHDYQGYLGSPSNTVEEPAEPQGFLQFIPSLSYLPESDLPIPKSNWIPDTPECMSCKVSFSILNRRHHCRICGIVVCNKCSQNRLWDERTCDRCYHDHHMRIARMKTKILRKKASIKNLKSMMISQDAKLTESGELTRSNNNNNIISPRSSPSPPPENNVDNNSNNNNNISNSNNNINIENGGQMSRVTISKANSNPNNYLSLNRFSPSKVQVQKLSELCIKVIQEHYVISTYIGYKSNMQSLDDIPTKFWEPLGFMGTNATWGCHTVMGSRDLSRSRSRAI